MKFLKKYRVPESAITEKGLKRLLKRAARDYSSLSDWAVDHGITPQAVSAFMRGTQGAGLQIPRALGYRPQTVFLPDDEALIANRPPPRKPTKNPTSKVDHSKDPVEKKWSKAKDPRKEAKKRLKKRSRR